MTTIKILTFSLNYNFSTADSLNISKTTGDDDKAKTWQKYPAG